jgi:hypothetical protein
MKAYDVVITRDGPLTVANLIVDAISEKKINKEKYKDFPQL